MKYLILTFKSKNNLFSFVKTLRNINIETAIINTPRAISYSCGLSAKIHFRHYQQLKILINNNLNIISSVYLIEKIGSKELTQKLF